MNQTDSKSSDSLTQDTTSVHPTNGAGDPIPPEEVEEYMRDAARMLYDIIRDFLIEQQREKAQMQSETQTVAKQKSG